MLCFFIDLEFVPTRSVAKKSTTKKSEDKYIISNAFVPKPLVEQIPEGKVEVSANKTNKNMLLHRQNYIFLQPKYLHFVNVNKIY